VHAPHLVDFGVVLVENLLDEQPVVALERVGPEGVLLVVLLLQILHKLLLALAANDNRQQQQSKHGER
jgi:hypothetical protein